MPVHLSSVKKIRDYSDYFFPNGSNCFKLECIFSPTGVGVWYVLCGQFVMEECYSLKKCVIAMKNSPRKMSYCKICYKTILERSHLVGGRGGAGSDCFV